MGRACSVCASEALAEVDNELAAQRSFRSIALRHQPLTEWAIARHQRAHLSPAIVAVSAKRRERRALTLLQRVERLVSRLEAAADDAEDQRQRKALLDTSRELRGGYELLGRLTGELAATPAVQVLNVQASPEWISLRSRVLRALEAHPAARAAVVAALSTDGTEYHAPPLLPATPVLEAPR